MATSLTMTTDQYAVIPTVIQALRLTYELHIGLRRYYSLGRFPLKNKTETVEMEDGSLLVYFCSGIAISTDGEQSFVDLPATIAELPIGTDVRTAAILATEAAKTALYAFARQYDRWPREFYYWDMDA